MRTTPSRTQARYPVKRAHRARGIADLERRIGAVCDDIDQRLARQEDVRILELGCGYGTALLEMRSRYGARVDLHGLNRAPRDGDRDMLLHNAVKRGLPVDDASPERALPTIAYADAASGLPFADNTFDLVVSQVAWLYFGNKIRVLQEVIRVMKPNGVAMIDADEVCPGLPPEYARLVEIWRDGRLVPFGDYLQGFGVALKPAPEGTLIAAGKCIGLGDDLTLLYEIDTSRLHGHWDGIKCVYRMQEAVGLKL